MKAGVWFYAVGTALTGLLNIAWRAFDASHQPIRALGNVPGQKILACITGLWMVAAGFALLGRRTARWGAVACGAAYLVFVALWLARYFAAIHALGWRIDVLFGISFGLGEQLLLVAPAAILYVALAPADAHRQARATVAARWMLGLPPIVFGVLHLVGFRVFARIVPHWLPGGEFWAVFTGIAFLLAGLAICSGIQDVLAARSLALMLLLFEFLVEVPPIFARLHNQPTWGAATYNVAAIGGCWIFAEFLARSADRTQFDPAEDVGRPHPVAA
jgi:uncharacterized membrane protein